VIELIIIFFFAWIIYSFSSFVIICDLPCIIFKMADTIEVSLKEGTRFIVLVRWSIESVKTKSNDWIGLFRVGDEDNKYVSFHHTYGALYGTIAFDLEPHLKEGQHFDVRLFSAKNKLAASVPFEVSTSVRKVLGQDCDQNDLAIMAAEVSEASYEELKDDLIMFCLITATPTKYMMESVYLYQRRRQLLR